MDSEYWLLWVSAPDTPKKQGYWACAVYQKKGGERRCIDAAPDLNWVYNYDITEVAAHLSKKKLKEEIDFGWIKEDRPVAEGFVEATTHRPRSRQAPPGARSNGQRGSSR
jgi:hypothetical protein